MADNVRILAPQANVLASPIITHSQIFLLEPLHKDKIQIHSLVASDVQLLETLINQFDSIWYAFNTHTTQHHIELGIKFKSTYIYILYIHLSVTKNRRLVHIEQRYVLDLRKIKTQKKTFEIHHLTDNNQKR